MSMYDDFDEDEKGSLWKVFEEADWYDKVSGDIPDIPGHESGCPWAVKKVCVCEALFDTRREAFNEGWTDGYEEGFDEGFLRGKEFGES